MSLLHQIVTTTSRHLMFYGAGLDDQANVKRIFDFLRTADNPFSRSTLSGHVTASAWVVNDSCTRVYLIKHAALQKWIQPGGHIDEGEYPAEAAVREAFEETGLSGLQIMPPGLFDIDIHTIPENDSKGEPEHTHYDLRYLLRADDAEGNLNTRECSDGQWFDLKTLSVDESKMPSLRRMAAKTIRYIDGASID